jgi:hypothetical protein
LRQVEVHYEAFSAKYSAFASQVLVSLMALN